MVHFILYDVHYLHDVLLICFMSFPCIAVSFSICLPFLLMLMQVSYWTANLFSTISLLFLRSVSSFNTSTFSVCVLFLYFSVVSHRNTNAAKSKPIHKQNSRNQSDPWSMLNKFKRCTLSAYQNYISMSSLSFQWTATTTTKLLKINLLKDYANGLLWWPRARGTREFCFIKMLPQNVYLPRLRLWRTSVWA